ncbi:MAG: error-prone DNA polymerase [Hellea sp.]|nr:error-prone DNA polymerase [Hellea sp.]
MSFAELSVTTNFTFLTGASHPHEYMVRAAELGLSAVAVTDTNTFAGIVRAHAAAKELGLKFIVGVRLCLQDGPDIVALPKTREAYARICRLLTIGKRRTTKGHCELYLKDVAEWSEGSVLIILGQLKGQIRRLIREHKSELYLGMAPAYDGRDGSYFAARAKLAKNYDLPLVALGDILMHKGSRRRLADVLSCIREHSTIDNLGRLALPNSERRLKSEFEMRRLFGDYPKALAATMEIARLCTFSLDELKYEYPDEVTDGLEPQQRLIQLTKAGLKWRYPDGVPLRVQAMIEKELRVIAELDYARYFLTVYDVVKFARSKNILCQGRGSAANSVVCYALGITEASPETISMVFERFISEVRNEPPDIDVDFEHERREEVIQHIYEKYGRHRAGICSTVSHFRSRGAVREVGKAMGLSEDVITAISSQVWGWSSKQIDAERVTAAGLDLMDPRLRQTFELTHEIMGFPRHLSQHVGGFVITRGRLDELCPVENAAMADRTIIEWDKDDIDVLGMLKIDVLALGMLTCLRKGFDMLRSWKGVDYALATLPQEDPAVYDMLCVADTVGVFQVESRAQMNFLPRMRPRCFYDLVIEVAIIRPGPIQGDMVHPYIKRRRGEEAVVFPSKDLEPVLGKTLGIPLFQEQAMQIASVAAGFSPSEADQLRRALGTFRGDGTVARFKDRFIQGCLDNGYDHKFADAVFRQLEGFSGYGFPESHAASFALLVYASSWMKCHHPEVFCAALLNSQPMGFYAPAQIVRDAREHKVKVLPICAERSYWDNVLEPIGNGLLAVRLGFRQIKGFKEEDGLWMGAARGNGYRSVDAIWRRAGLGRRALSKLAEADAFNSYGLSRRDALWAVKGLGGEKPLPLFEQRGEGHDELPANLPEMSLSEHVFADYVSTRLSLREHPVALLSDAIGKRAKSESLRDRPDGSWISVSGLVITRQRPGTASGVIFLTLEDEGGVANVVVWPNTFETHRKIVMGGRLIKVTGRLQREGIVTHLIANRIEDLSYLLDTLADPDIYGDTIEPTRNNADEAKNPIPLSSKPMTDKSARPPVPKHPEPKHQPGTITKYYASSGARHPREQAKKLFPSRDFH